MQQKGDMTVGNPGKLIFAFSVPMILGNIVQQLYTLVDSAVVGRFVGKDSLAAVGATQSVLLLLICVIIGLTMGICILTSQSFGAGDEEKVKNIAGAAVYVVIGLTILIFVLGLFLVRPVLALLDTPDELMEEAVVYLLINTCTSVAPIVYNMTGNIMRALGDSKSPLYALVCSSLMNIALDLLFVVVFHWGVAGAAWATAISQAVSAGVNLWFIFRKHPLLHIRKENLKLRSELIWNVICVGVPMSVQNAVASVGAMGVQGIVNGYGTDTIAAYTAAGKIDQISMMPLNSLGLAVSTYVGQNFGRRDMNRIRKGMRAGILQAVLWGLGLMLLILLLGGVFAGLFVEKQEVAVVAIAKEYLHTVAFFYWLCGIMYVMLNAFRGMGRMTLSTVASCLDPACRLLFAVILGHALGRAGIWMAWPSGWCFGLLLPLVVWLFRGRNVTESVTGGNAI